MSNRAPSLSLSPLGAPHSSNRMERRGIINLFWGKRSYFSLDDETITHDGLACYFVACFNAVFPADFSGGEQHDADR